MMNQGKRIEYIITTTGTFSHLIFDKTCSGGKVTSLTNGAGNLAMYMQKVESSPIFLMMF